MLHHRAVYDSIELQETTSLVVGGGSDESEIHPQIQSSFRPRLLATKRALLYSLVFLGLVGLFATDLKFDIPLLGQSLRKHYAQSVADDFILTYLATPRELKREHKPPVHYSPEGCEATVVIVRHCEKGSTREHCSYNGYERSVYLSTIFGDGDERWPTPSYIFALDAGKRHNSKKRVYREMETVLPLAVKSNVQVDYSYDVSHSNQLGEHMSNMLHSGEVCGKVAVICWKHSGIPHLAHKLGCGPTQGCPADYPSYTFDQAWQIKFVYKHLSHSERKSGYIPKHGVWEVYGNVIDEGFDPLAFSKKMGDYVPGGKAQGASWKALDVEVPEEGLPKDWDHLIIGA